MVGAARRARAGGGHPEWRRQTRRGAARPARASACARVRSEHLAGGPLWGRLSEASLGAPAVDPRRQPAGEAERQVRRGEREPPRQPRVKRSQPNGTSACRRDSVGGRHLPRVEVSRRVSVVAVAHRRRMRLVEPVPKEGAGRGARGGDPDRGDGRHRHEGADAEGRRHRLLKHGVHRRLKGAPRSLHLGGLRKGGGTRVREQLGRRVRLCIRDEHAGRVPAAQEPPQSRRVGLEG